LFLSAGSNSASGQTAVKSEKEEKGITFYESLQGSSNTLGQAMKLDSTVGYDFGKHFGIDFGMPVYFVRPSSSLSGTTTTTTTTTSSATGVGNAYVDLRLRLDNPLINYASTLDGTAPTGDASKGFSTGRATFDWNNHFDRSLVRLTPFLNLGVANTVSDTHFFTRPFSTLGLVGHFEGGADYQIWHFVSVGASAYDILPTGQQKVFSKLVTRTTTKKASETTGGADIARDNGVSAWFDLDPTPFLDFEVGYSRSVHYNLDTVSFGVGVNLGYFIRKSKRF
jgi:hypothetical protein